MKSKPIIVCDANILIDYIDSNGVILCLASAHCYEIFTPEIVLKEVLGKRPKLDIGALGVRTCEVLLEQLFEAETFSNSCALSIQDSLCFIIARDNSWICATNEKALYNKCLREKLKTMRGLQFMFDLAMMGKLAKADAIETARKISSVNPRLPQSVVEDFIKMLDSIK